MRHCIQNEDRRINENERSIICYPSEGKDFLLRKTGAWKKIWKKGFVCICLCMLLAAFGQSGNMQAYFTDGIQKDNVTKVGTVEVKIREEFQQPEEILPGQTIQKRVQIENMGSAPCYVRVKAVFSDSRIEKYCTVDWNLTDWFYNSAEEYVYYKEVLKPGEKTRNLMTEIAISEQSRKENLRSVQLLVYTESCQAGSFPDWQTAWDEFMKNR